MFTFLAVIRCPGSVGVACAGNGMQPPSDLALRQPPNALQRQRTASVELDVVSHSESCAPPRHLTPAYSSDCRFDIAAQWIEFVESGLLDLVKQGSRGDPAARSWQVNLMLLGTKSPLQIACALAHVAPCQLNSSCHGTGAGREAPKSLFSSRRHEDAPLREAVKANLRRVMGLFPCGKAASVRG
jgi:hypothetical protein